eukprot:COSAG01_NODE_426_length_17219_cov_9.275637_12_plen_98_part_00
MSFVAPSPAGSSCTLAFASGVGVEGAHPALFWQQLQAQQADLLVLPVRPPSRLPACQFACPPALGTHAAMQCLWPIAYRNPSWLTGCACVRACVRAG